MYVTSVLVFPAFQLEQKVKLNLQRSLFLPFIIIIIIFTAHSHLNLPNVSVSAHFSFPCGRVT